MEQTTVKRSMIIASLVFAIVICGAGSLLLFMFFYGCSFGGDRFECSMGSNIFYFSIVASLVFISLLIRALSKPITPQIFKILSLVYFAFVTITIFASVSFREGGVMFSLIKGTKAECQLILDFNKEWCYLDLAKAQDNIAYCKKTKTYQGCYEYFAVLNKDVSVCPSDDDYCLSRAAKELADASICERVGSFVRSMCYAGVAEKTNDLRLCEYSDARYAFCDGSNKQVEQNPDAFITASQMDVFSEIINPDVKTGQKDVDLIKITAKSPGGISALNGFQFIMDNGSIFDVFPNFGVYIDNGQILKKISSGGVFSSSKERPSKASFSFPPVMVYPDKSATFIIRADTSDFQGVLRFLEIEAQTLGKTEDSSKIIGSANIKISK